MQRVEIKKNLSSHLEEIWMLELSQLLATRQHIYNSPEACFEIQISLDSIEAMPHFQYLMKAFPKVQSV